VKEELRAALGRVRTPAEMRNAGGLFDANAPNFELAAILALKSIEIAVFVFGLNAE
jgi:hypothetical protein